MRWNCYVLHNTFEKKVRVTTWTQVVLFSIETSLAVGGTFLASTFLSVSIETRTAVTHTVQVPFWKHSFRTQWCTVTWKRGFKRIRSVYNKVYFRHTKLAKFPLSPPLRFAGSRLWILKTICRVYDQILENLAQKKKNYTSWLFTSNPLTQSETITRMY